MVERPKLAELFEAIEAQLYRYPAIDAGEFARRVTQRTGNWQ
jgi:hypothetical protein